MNELLKKQWNYRLFKNSSDEYVLSVLCGTIGLYEVDVKLTSKQIEDYETYGEKIIDELAQKIRNNPSSYLK